MPEEPGKPIRHGFDGGERFGFLQRHVDAKPPSNILQVILYHVARASERR